MTNLEVETAEFIATEQCQAEEEQAFEAAIDFLANRTRFGINLGLARIEKLLAYLGNPHQQGISYIHVGGTNGKGSTAAFLGAILQAAGYRVGLFTSPHLHCYTERMVINGKQISKPAVVELIEKIRPLLAKMEAEGSEPPTEFEVNTAMAFQYFTQQQVDYAIIEVGMGGEIDSTNVILPKLAIITNVAMDHMAYLGNTPVEIARVKVGIIKEGTPIITGSKSLEVLEVIRGKAKTQNSLLLELGKDFGWKNAWHSQGSNVKQTFAYEGKGEGLDMVLTGLETGLLGKHQLDNGALAITAALLLGVSTDAIRQGVGGALWPGRLEAVSQKPLIVLDGAHNQHGMAALKEAVLEYWPDKQIVLLVGMLGDKEREKALAQILPLVDKVVITKVPSERAGDWQALAKICQQFDQEQQKAEKPSAKINSEIYVIEDVKAACSLAKNLIKSKDDLLLVTGSLYMLGTARAYFCKLT